jgi:hypothetical protein
VRPQGDDDEPAGDDYRGGLAGGHLGFGMDWAQYDLRTIVAEVQQYLKTAELDIPVVFGEPRYLRYGRRWRPLNGQGTWSYTAVRLEAPKGWKIENAPSTNSDNDSIRTVLLTPPLERADFALKVGPTNSDRIVVSGLIDGDSFNATARVHLLPRLTVPRLPAALHLIVAANDLWARLPSHLISHTNLWQGRTRNDADSSGTLRIGHDGESLYVEVLVRDDEVVSNIAPNDIKGHWRSDSVEICLDPMAGSEDTLGCYKIGIFPFDTTGAVRAARDADANQGPVEETAPNTRLLSWRTADGYGIRAAIPFHELGISQAIAKKLGFNILIYDGDKRDAAMGENINKSRIAWSPWPGVQGRPEDWGRIDLE